MGIVRIGQTFVKQNEDQVYVELYEETGRELADAIDALAKQRLAKDQSRKS